MSDLAYLPVAANDAEVSLLGAVMAGAPNIPDLLDAVDPADFAQPLHEHIWRAIAAVVRDGRTPDVVAVRAALDAANVRHDPVRLFELTHLVPTVAQASWYASQVVTAAGMRRIQEAGVRLHAIATTPGDLAERREQARQAVDEACRGREVSRARLLADVLPEVIDVAQSGTGACLSTPWPDLDRLIGGIAPGRLIVVGARPGIGKSVLAANLALHVAHRHGHGVLFASLEMSEREVGQRILAAHARVDLTRLAEGTTEDAEWDRIGPRVPELDALPLVIDDAPGQTVTHIRAAARNAQRRRDDLALIVVDYLQLVTPDRTGGSRAEDVGTISRGLKMLARESGACVVAAAQVNRESTRNSDGRPRLSDLRESGSIEADADQVILLHQPDDDLPEIEALVAKNRHGSRGLARLQMAGHHATLRSIDWTPTAAIRGDA